MRTVFAGTPEFAAGALAALLDAGHAVPLVLTRPDKPAGRGKRAQESPVKQLALARGLTIAQPPTLRDASALEPIRAAAPEVIIVAAYGLILPRTVLAIAPRGCINIHASLLPRWRGAAPIQRAIEAGDHETGITIMQMDEGLDTGPMLLARSMPIGPDDTGGTLHDRLAGLGATLIVEALAKLEAGGLTPVAQPADGATYAGKLDKRESAIDWQADATRLADRIRAFDPHPGSTMVLADDLQTVLKVWRATALPLPGAGQRDGPDSPGSVGQDAGGRADAAPAAGDIGGLREPGEVLRAGPAGVDVACGRGVLRLLELQRPGGRRLPAGEFLKGFPIRAGQRLSTRFAGGQFTGNKV